MPDLEPDQLFERLRRHGSLQGDLAGRYARLRRLFPSAVEGAWLYYAGPTTVHYCPNAPRFAADLLEMAEVPAGMLPFEPSSGLDVLAAGYPEVAARLAAGFRDAVLSLEPCGLICGSPRDAALVELLYEDWGCALDRPVVQASVFFSTLWAEGILHLRPEFGELPVLFVPSMGFGPTWEQAGLALEALNSIFEGLVELAELDSVDAEANPDLLPAGGSGVSAWLSTPDEFALEAVWQQALEQQSELLVTDDPLTYAVLYDRADGTGVWVKDICQVLAEYASSTPVGEAD